MPAPITFLSKSMISKVRAQIGTSNVENYRPNSLIHSNLRSFAVSDSLAGNFCTNQELLEQMFRMMPDPRHLLSSTHAFTFAPSLDYSRVTQWKARMPQRNTFAAAS